MPVGNREHHHTDRIGWLRVAVLGANDGILSTSSLVFGVAAAHATHRNLLVPGMAGLVVGACIYMPTGIIDKKSLCLQSYMMTRMIQAAAEVCLVIN